MIEAQRAPSAEERAGVGNDIDAVIVAHARAFALLQGAADRAMDDRRRDAEADELLKLADRTHDALIVAIAERIRKAETDAARWRFLRDNWPNVLLTWTDEETGNFGGEHGDVPLYARTPTITNAATEEAWLADTPDEAVDSARAAFARSRAEGPECYRHPTATNPENENGAPRERHSETIAIKEVTDDDQ